MFVLLELSLVTSLGRNSTLAENSPQAAAAPGIINIIGNQVIVVKEQIYIRLNASGWGRVV